MEEKDRKGNIWRDAVVKKIFSPNMERNGRKMELKPAKFLKMLNLSVK